MLKVYNSLKREEQEFKPIHEGFVGIYVCGPTVYGHSHIGHAKSYVSFDVIIRYLRYLDYRVRYVQNITDVGHLTDDADEGEDKVGLKAREMGVEPMEVAETFTRSYFEDMDALNIRRPDICPRASGHIPEQIALVRELLENGHAYQVDGNVYFDVMSFEDYGKLSGRDLDQMLENVRVDERAEKRSPLDFALWKKAEERHLMNWESPWSVGYPGWHVECSAMGLKYLGPTLDIHGGGLENIFPHHENEIAQSEGATGEQFVRYWLHNNMVTVEGRKMGKSLGNFITLKDAFGGDPPLEEPVRPMVIRYFILNSHYRSPLDFSAEALEAARKGLERIENAASELRKRREIIETSEDEVADHIQQIVDETQERFEGEMNDDFNTAGAIGELSKYTHLVNQLLDAGSPLNSTELAALDGLYSELGEQVLGILRDAGAGEKTGGKGLGKDLIETMIETRAALREAGQFDLADHIRDRLAGLGIVLKDEANGTEWKCE